MNLKKRLKQGIWKDKCKAGSHRRQEEKSVWVVSIANADKNLSQTRTKIWLWFCDNRVLMTSARAISVEGAGASWSHLRNV